jgi:hypothetical protein
MYIEYGENKKIKSVMFGNINLLNDDIEYISVRDGDENIKKNKKGIYELNSNSLYVNENTKSSPFALELL